MKARAETYGALADGCRFKAAHAVNIADRSDWLGLADSWMQLLKDVQYEGEFRQALPLDSGRPPLPRQ